MEISNIFQSGMVLQRRKPINIYGTGAGHVEVTLGENTVKGDFTGDEWVITLPEMSAGGPYTMTVKTNEETKAFDDILIGDVILVSGQSNLQYKVGETINQYKGMPACVKSDRIRTFILNRPELEWRGADCGEKLLDRWASLSPENIEYWSAIGYFYAVKHSTEQNCPVGVVCCYQGASMIQSFIEKSLITENNLDIPAEKKHNDFRAYNFWNRDGFIHDYMVKRLFPMSLCAVLWYQGESNTTEAESAVYDKFLSVLVESWRKNFRDSELPFIIFQLHGYDTSAGWKGVQRKQAEFAASGKNTALVITEDVSERENIHPKEKQPVAERAYEAAKKFF